MGGRRGRRGGGRNRQFGDVAISISATFEDAARAINSLEAQFGRLKQAVRGVRLEPQFQEELDNARETIDDFIERIAGLGEVDIFGRNIDELNQTEAAIRKIERALEGLVPSREAEERLSELRAQAERLRLALGTPVPSQGAPVTQTVLQQVKSLNQLETQIRSTAKAFGDLDDAGDQVQAEVAQLTEQWVAQARALGVSDKAIQQFQHRIDHLSKGVGVLGRGAAATGPFAFLEKGVDRASAALNRLGLNFRDVSVIAGAGFLSGGIAFAVRAFFDLAAAVGKAALALAQMGAQLESFRNKTEIAFRGAADEVRAWSRTTAEEFGLSEVRALQLIGTIGNLFRSFGVGREEAAEMAIGLAEIARVIQRTSFTADTYEQVLSKLQGGLTGNIEALREYGIAVNETSLKQAVAVEGIRVYGGELTAAEKAMAAYIFELQQAELRMDDFNRVGETQATVQEQLTAAWQNFQSDLGTLLAPALLEVTEAGLALLDWIQDAAEDFRDWARDNEELIDGLQELAGIAWDRWIDDLETVVDVLGAVAKGLRPVVDLLDKAGKAIDFIERLVPDLPELPPWLGGPGDEPDFELSEEFAREIGVVEKDVDKFVRKQKELFDAMVPGGVTEKEAQGFLEKLAEMSGASLEEVKKEYLEFFDELVETRPELAKYRDALAAVETKEFDLARAKEQALEQAEKLFEQRKQDPKFLRDLVEAYETLEDAIENAAKAEADALKALEKAREDGAKRKADAEERLTEAREDAAEREQDAREALAEAEEDRQEAISEAREKLREVEEDQAERVRDAEEKLRETRIDSTRKVSDAERKLHEARLKHAEQITDAQLSLEEALHRGDIFAINRAQLALSRAKRERGVQEAELDLQEARLEAVEAIEDAEEALHEAREERIKAIEDATKDLNETIEDHNEKVEEARERLNDAIIEGLERVAEAEENLTEVREETLERIKDAEEKLIEVREKGTEAIEDARDRVLELEGGFRDTKEEVIELNKELDKLRLKLTDVTDLIFVGTGPADLALLNAQGRQHGGSVFSRHPYFVGESGPELFIPNHAGSVVPNEQLIRLLQQMMAGGAMTWGGRQSIQIPVYEAVDPLATAEAIAARLARSIVQ